MASCQRILAILLLPVALCAAPVHTTYIWHLEQPIYWPDRVSISVPTYERAWESIHNGGPHPENDVAAIFSVADRVAAYQWRPKESIALMTGSDAGAQVTYTGGLVENVQSLAAANALGYTSSWNTDFQTARNWSTSGGRPRMEMVIIPHHHALCPLVDPKALEKEIQIYQYLYPQVWGSSPAQSVGFFPPELAFSERVIPTLVANGISWVFVPSNHISRAIDNFPLVLGTGGENCDPPNQADQINPDQSNWFSLTISRGCTPTDAYPYSFQPHYAQYVDPQTQAISQIIAVPVAMAMSWQDGYQMYGTDDIDEIAWANDPNHPMIVVLGHDGDNAWGGGYSYYMESVPAFTAEAVSKGYEPTTVPEFLADHPVATGDITHVEDGAWVNADGDFGSPQFINWNWPLYNASGQFDIANGWALDERNWAVITAAQNRVETAEQIAGGVSIANIQNPLQGTPSNADLAWHFFLASLNSGYMYYGASLDMEVKPSLACNWAAYYADMAIGSGSSDATAPTIWIPQQLPHNPGAIGYGPLWGYHQIHHSRDFWVWTFVYDLSGVEDVTFYYRLDNDGVNPISSIQNETYAGGAEVTSWRTLPMTRRVFPAGNVYNDPSINFDIMPTYIADEYYIHVTEPEIVDSGGVLVDYFVEAIDSLGYTKRSPIQHTYVGTGGAAGPSEIVWWWPENPQAGDSVVIYYDANLGALPPGTDTVCIHIGHSGWQGIVSPDPMMTFDADSQAWRYAYSIPQSATSVDFCFNDGQGHWDNNGGADWHITVTGGTSGFVMDGQLEASAELVGQNGSYSLWAAFNGDDFYVATQRAQGTGNDRFIFIADEPGAMQNAPWAKSGQVASWDVYLAEEANNGWCGWFDNSGAATSAAGVVLEGSLSLAGEFGSIPDQVYLALGIYATPDGGTLVGQVPAAVIPNGNIEASEWIELRLKPEHLTLISSGSDITLSWNPAFGATSYQVHLTSTPFEPLSENTQIATVTGPSFTHEGAVNIQAVGFYRVLAQH
jgi:hypothetical protein